MIFEILIIFLISAYHTGKHFIYDKAYYNNNRMLKQRIKHDYLKGEFDYLEEYYSNSSIDYKKLGNLALFPEKKNVIRLEDILKIKNLKQKIESNLKMNDFEVISESDFDIINFA